MSEVKNDNLDIRSPKTIDKRNMKFVGGVAVPYSSVAEAHSSITYKSSGVPIYIDINGVTIEHQYIGGWAQSNLVPMPINLVTDGLTTSGLGVTGNPLVSTMPNFVAFSVAEIRALPASIRDLPTTFKIVNPGRTYSTSEFTYDASDTTTPDDGVMHLTAVGGGTYHRDIQDDHIDVRWFGAQGDYTTDDADSIQAAINYILAHADCPKKLYFPRGQYMISKPLFIYKWDGTNYQFVKFELLGDGNAKIGMTDSGTSIKCMAGMGDKFMLGIQLGKGVVVKGIEFHGLYTKATTFTRSQIIRNKFSDWTQTGISAKRYAPHCGIIVDPFQYSVPPDGGYASMTSMYRGTAGSYGGSTDVKVINCRFNQFDVCFALGINGYTLNGEDMNVEDCDFNYSRVAYATGQTQTVGNTFRNFRVWTPVHTIIDGMNYGLTPGTPPHCHGGNIAGGNLGIYQFVNVASTTAAFVVNNLRAESIFKIGSVSPYYFTGFAASFVDCEIHLWDPSQFSELPTPDFLVQGKVNFINSHIEYVDPSIPHRLKLNNRFADLHFEGSTLSPVAVSRPGNPQEDVVTTLSGTTTWQYNHSLDKQSNRKGWNTMYPGYLTQIPIGGETKIKFSEGNGAVDWFFEWKNNTPDKLRYMGTTNILHNTTTGTCTLTVPSGWLSYVQVGDMLMSDSTIGWSYSDRNPDLNTVDSGTFPLSLWLDYSPTLGTITGISGTTVTLKGVGVNVPNGVTNNVPIYLQWIRLHNNPIAATITSGNTLITNVENTEINAPVVFGSYVGQRLEHPAIPDGVFVQSIGSGTLTLSAAAVANCPHAQIINGNPHILALSNYDPVSAIINSHCNLFEGAKWIEKRLSSLSNPYKYREFLINRATFSKSDGVSYLPSALHPISISTGVYTDSEQTDFSGRITFPQNTSSSSIQIGDGEIQSSAAGVLHLTSNLYYSTNFGNQWARRSTGKGTLINISNDYGFLVYKTPSDLAATVATITRTFWVDADGIVNISNLVGTGKRIVTTEADGTITSITNSTNGKALFLVGGAPAWAATSDNPIEVSHIIGKPSLTPLIAAGSGAGTGPTVSIVGTDLSGEVTVITGTSAGANVTIVTITFSVAYGVNPYEHLTPSNAAAAEAKVFISRVSATQFQITATSVALTDSTTYKWTYLVTQ